MAVSTNLGLYLPTREDYISVKRDLSDNYEIIDESAGMLEKGIAIVVDGDTAPRAISSGDYLFIKNHSTLATGGYHATANIANGAAVTSSNTASDDKGVANTINGDIISLNNKTNYKTIQEFVFNQLNSNGEKSTLSPSSYPTVPGVYRTITSFAGLPSGANVYGALIIFNAGTYWVHIYVNAVHEFYFAYMGSAGTPTTWRKMTGTAVDPVT